VHGSDLLSYLFAAIASFGNALSNVMQRKASLQKAPGTEFGGRFLVGLLRNPTWIIGFTGMVASFAFQAVALSLGQLSSVETIITLEVPLTLLFASQVFRAGIGRAEWGGIWVMTIGMIILIAALDPQPGDETNVSHTLYGMAGGGTVASIAVLLVAAQRGRVMWRTACLGAAAGCSFGLTATFIKEVTVQLSDRGVFGVVSTWQTYAAIGMGLSGVVIMQWALHTGPLLAAQPGFTLMDPTVSILWGVLVYNETTRTGGWIAIAVAGALGIAIGVLMLARSPLMSTLNEHDGRAEAPGVGRVITEP